MACSGANATVDMACEWLNLTIAGLPQSMFHGSILLFLQEQIDKGKAFSTYNVYLAVVAVFQVAAFGDKTVGQCPLGVPVHKGCVQASPCLQTTGASVGFASGSEGA